MFLGRRRRDNPEADRDCTKVKNFSRKNSAQFNFTFQDRKSDFASVVFPFGSLKRRILRFNWRPRASVRGLSFKCKATKVEMGGDLLLPGESRNLHWIAGLLIKCNSFAESPNLVQQTGPYSPSLLISCSVTDGAPFSPCR
jgi:hypothetical protein